jgi:hypothetical protein
LRRPGLQLKPKLLDVSRPTGAREEGLGEPMRFPAEKKSGLGAIRGRHELKWLWSVFPCRSFCSFAFAVEAFRFLPVFSLLRFDRREGGSRLRKPVRLLTARNLHMFGEDQAQHKACQFLIGTGGQCFTEDFVVRLLLFSSSPTKCSATPSNKA